MFGLLELAYSKAYFLLDFLCAPGFSLGLSLKNQQPLWAKELVSWDIHSVFPYIFLTRFLACDGHYFVCWMDVQSLFGVGVPWPIGFDLCYW